MKIKLGLHSRQSQQLLSALHSYSLLLISFPWMSQVREKILGTREMTTKKQKNNNRTPSDHDEWDAHR